MRRRSEEDAPASAPDEQLDTFLSGLLEKHALKLKVFAIALLVLLVIAILVARVAS
jgi:hypothetical protein